MSDSSAGRRPPFDPELEAALAALGDVEIARTENLTVADLSDYRARLSEANVPDLRVVDGVEIARTDHEVVAPDGELLVISVLRRKDNVSAHVPVLLHFHAGGMVVGDRFYGLSTFLPWVVDHHIAIATVEYRLAPEHPDPIPVEDCYAALRWVGAQADRIRVDPRQIFVAGISAGGGLAAGAALHARDRGGPPLAGLLLLSPMLDDRDDTLSSAQFEGIGAWNRESNREGWSALLGERRGGPDVSAYAAPARATDLTGFPPTFLDVGSAEVFRDEVVAFASRLWADGCDAELHVWPGGTHGWEWFVPGSAMSRTAQTTRDAWFGRVLDRL